MNTTCSILSKNSTNCLVTVLLFAFLSVIFNATAFSQVHYENFQGKHPLFPNEQDNISNTQVPFGYDDATVNNLGVFTIGNGTALTLLSNAVSNDTRFTSSFFMEPVGWTHPINTYGGERSLAVASNHNTQIALVSGTVIMASKEIDGVIIPTPASAIVVAILNSSPSSIDVAGLTVLQPSPATSGATALIDPSVSDFGQTIISHVEAKMNDKYLYITWKQAGGFSPTNPLANFLTQFPGATYFGYAVYDVQNNLFAIPPKLMLDPNGDLAIGQSAPTVACNRWTDSPDGAEMAFPYIDQQDMNFHRVHAAHFAPVVGSTIFNSANLVEPAIDPLQKCEWVRVLNFEEFEGNSGFHFFYGYLPPSTFNTLNVSLFATDGNPAVAPVLIDNQLPPEIYNIYAPPGCGNGYTEKSVYFIWARDEQPTAYTSQIPPRQRQDLMICRDFGVEKTLVYGQDNITNPTNPRNPGEANFILNCTLGCNQMGIYITFTPEIGYSYYIRASRPFAQHVRENTLVTGDCQITQNQFHNPQHETDVRVLPFYPGIPSGRLQFADTMRILGWNLNKHYIDNDDGTQFGGYDIYAFKTSLKFVNTPAIPGIPALYAGIPSSANITEGNYLLGGRGYIIMDPPSSGFDYGFGGAPDEGPDAEIDFNNIPGVRFGAVSHGGFEYNGTTLKNMQGTSIVVDGYHSAPDTTEEYKALAFINYPLKSDHGPTMTDGVGYGIYSTQVLSQKGQIRFKDASTAFDPTNLDNADGMKLLYLHDGSTFLMDSSVLILGSRNTGQTLEQIRMNNGTFVIFNSTVTTGWEALDGYLRRPAGYCSEINLVSSSATIDNNKFFTTFVNASDPGSFAFNNNDVYDIRNQVNLVRTTDPPQFPQPITIDNNTVHANFPHGNADWSEEAIDFEVTGFTGTGYDGSSRPVEISGNTIIGNTTSSGIPFQYNWTGIQIDQGTNANVTSNSISDIGIGIFHEGLGATPSAYLCSNTVTHCCPGYGFGIVQDQGLGVTKLNDLNHNAYGYWAQKHDQSILLRNNIHDNVVGGTFVDNAETRLNGLHTQYENLAGMNNFDNNLDLGDNFSGSLYQMWISSNNATVIAQPIIGLGSGGTDDGTWGQNKFRSVQTLQIPIYHVVYSGISSTMSLINSIQLNDWDPPIPTSSNLIPASPTGTIVNIEHFNEANKPATLANLACSEDNESAHGKQTKTLSYPNTSTSICDISPDDSLYLYVRAANCWINVDARKAIDTVRLYVERHPFATHLPGEVLDAINDGYGFVGSLTPHPVKNDWIEAYNWLLKIMPLNQEPPFQYTVLETLANDLGQFDLNESANMWWNMTLLYPDTGNVRTCWNSIRSIRHYQKEIPQDTTPFHKLNFPLQPLAGVTPSHTQNIHVEMNLVPNPAKFSTEAKISMSEPGMITLEVFDLLGKKVKNIFHGYVENSNIPIDTHDLGQGEYYIRLQSSGGIVTQKLIVNH